jgi:hypothetical protein
VIVITLVSICGRDMDSRTSSANIPDGRGSGTRGTRGTPRNGKDTTALGDVLEVRKVAGRLIAHATYLHLWAFVC